MVLLHSLTTLSAVAALSTTHTNHQLSFISAIRKAKAGAAGSTAKAAADLSTVNAHLEAGPIVRHTCQVHGNAYDFSYQPTPYNFQEASSLCEQNGGKLASIHNIEQNQCVQDFVIEHSKTTKIQAWIGLSNAPQYAGRSGTFVWVDSSLTGYWNWAPGTAPDTAPGGGQTGSGNCTLMYSDAYGALAGKWESVDCQSMKAPSICLYRKFPPNCEPTAWGYWGDAEGTPDKCSPACLESAKETENMYQVRTAAAHGSCPAQRQVQKCPADALKTQCGAAPYTKCMCTAQCLKGYDKTWSAWGNPVGNPPQFTPGFCSETCGFNIWSRHKFYTQYKGGPAPATCKMLVEEEDCHSSCTCAVAGQNATNGGKVDPSQAAQAGLAPPPLPYGCEAAFTGDSGGGAANPENWELGGCPFYPASGKGGHKECIFAGADGEPLPTCCSSEMVSATGLGDMVSNAVGSISPSNLLCRDAVAALTCTFCSPHSGAFIMTNTSTGSLQVNICQATCESLWASCQGEAMFEEWKKAVTPAERLEAPNGNLTSADEFCKFADEQVIGGESEFEVTLRIISPPAAGGSAAHGAGAGDGTCEEMRCFMFDNLPPAIVAGGIVFQTGEFSVAPDTAADEHVDARVRPAPVAEDEKAEKKKGSGTPALTRVPASANQLSLQFNQGVRIPAPGWPCGPGGATSADPACEVQFYRLADGGAPFAPQLEGGSVKPVFSVDIRTGALLNHTQFPHDTIVLGLPGEAKGLGAMRGGEMVVVIPAGVIVDSGGSSFAGTMFKVEVGGGSGGASGGTVAAVVVCLLLVAAGGAGFVVWRRRGGQLPPMPRLSGGGGVRRVFNSRGGGGGSGAGGEAINAKLFDESQQVHDAKEVIGPQSAYGEMDDL